MPDRAGLSSQTTVLLALTPAGRASACLAHSVTAGTAAAALGPEELIHQPSPCVLPFSRSLGVGGLLCAGHSAGHGGPTVFMEAMC